MAALDFTPQLLVGLGFGELTSESLAFDCLGGDAFEVAKRQGKIKGLYRLGGRARGDKSPDMRPFCLEPQIAAALYNDSASWSNTRGDIENAAFLQTSPGAFGGGGSVWFQNNAFPNFWEFTSANALQTNEAWGLRAYVSDVSDATGVGTAKGHIVYANFGTPGRGFQFRIRDGNAEILHLAAGWNATDETALHLLYGLPDDEITEPDLDEIARLESLLYDVSEGLSFEGGLGRDEWRGAGWTLLFMPEPRGVNQLKAGLTEKGSYNSGTSYAAGNIVVFANARWEALEIVLGVEPGSDEAKWRQLRGNAGNGKAGAVHFLLEGGAVATLDLASAGDFLDADGIAHPPTGDLWRATPISIGATGGEVGWQILNVRFNPSGTAEWGWFGSSSDTTTWTNLVTNVDATGPGKDSDGHYLTSATLEKVDDTRETGEGGSLPSLRLKLKATLTTSNSLYTPIAHAISTRRPNGVRSNAGDDTVLFDSLALPNDTQPITNVQLRLDESGARSVDFTLRDVNGKTKQTRTLSDFAGHMATFKIGDAPWLTSGPLLRGRDNDLRRLAVLDEGSGTLSRGGASTSNPETNFELTLDDGRWLDDDSKCSTPLILDGLFLGEAIRVLKKAAGWSSAEIALIPSAIGPRLPERSAGDSWCYVVDAGTSLDGAIQGLLDRFGFGLRYGRNHLGVWFLETVPTTSRFAFTSNGARNDPNLLRGGTREVELRPLVWEIDHSDYHTRFTVIGGLKGREIRRSFVNRAAVKLLPGNIAGPHFRGHHKDYEVVRDEGLRTAADVDSALMALVWRYGRPGRVAQFKSYLHSELIQMDRGTCDGVRCEIISWEGTLDAEEKERGQYRVREVI